MTVSTVDVTVNPGSGWNEVASSPTAPWFLKPNFTGGYRFAITSGSAPVSTPVAATGSVTISGGVPTAAQTLVIGSETYTFVASRSAPFQVTIGADATATGNNLVTALAADSALVTGSNALGVVTLTARAAGLIGNYALSTAATHVSVSGAAMTGGADPVHGCIYGANPYLAYEGLDKFPPFSGKAWVKVDAVSNQAQVTSHYPVVFTTMFTA